MLTSADFKAIEAALGGSVSGDANVAINGEAIGMCGLIKRETLDDVDLGYAFLPTSRGGGYAYEACSATMTYARETLGLQRIVAIVSPGNERSIALLEKLGFRFEKSLRLPPKLEQETLLYAAEG